MTTSLAHTRPFGKTTVLPQSAATSRRLILAPDSFDRIIRLADRWWESDARAKQSRWNSRSFAEMIDATMAPDSMMIVDLARKRDSDRRLDVPLSLLDMLSGFDGMLAALQGKIGTLRIHYGYNLRTNAMPSIDFDCGGSASSVVHLITDGVWQDLFQLYHYWPSSSIDAAWASVLTSLAGLSEPIKVSHSFFAPLVDPGFECPFDEIAEVVDSYHCFCSGLPAGLNVYATARTEG
jgi:hypothetical protein